MNAFKEKIFQEFEANLSRTLGMTIEEYSEIFHRRGEDALWEFETALREEGPEAARFMMNWSIVNLSVIYHEREMGRKMTSDEIKEHAINLDLGLEHF